MSKVCAFLQNFDGAQLTPQDFYNFTVTAAAADSVASVSKLNRVTYAYIAPVIIAIGVVGDVLTVATLTHPLLRRCSIIYTYLTLLAMTDLLTHFSVVPMILWLLDWRLCSPMSAFYYAHVGFPLANALMGASVWLVVFLTFSQYMAVCQPFYQGYLRKRRMCFILFILSYVFSFCIYAPWSTKKSVYTVPRGLLKCSYVVCDRHKLEEWFWLYEWVREFLTRLLPFFLIAYFNVMILVTYRSTKLDRMRRLTQSKHKRGATERSEKEEKRLFGLLFGIIIVFFLCTIPAAPLTIFVADRRSQNFTFQVFRAVTNLLEFTKFALNFYFYCLINPDIRKICLRIIQCRKLGRPARVKGQPVNPISIYTRSTKSTIRGANGGAGLGTTMPNTQLHSRRDSIRSRTSNRQLRRANTGESPRRGSMIAARIAAANPILTNKSSADDSFLSLPVQKKRSASATFLSAEPFVPTLLIQNSEATKRCSAPADTSDTKEKIGVAMPLLRVSNESEADENDPLLAASTSYSMDDDGVDIIVLARVESIERDKVDNTISPIIDLSERSSTKSARRRHTDRPSDLLDFNDFETSPVSAPEILDANTAALSEIAQIAVTKLNNDGIGNKQIWLPDPNSDKMRLFAKLVSKAQKSIIGSSPLLSGSQAITSPTLSTSSKLVHRDQEVRTLTKVAARAQPRAYSFGHQLRGRIKAGTRSSTVNISRSLRDHRQRISDGAISHAVAMESDQNNNVKSRHASTNSGEIAALLTLVAHAKSGIHTDERFAAPSPISKSGHFDYAVISSDDATSLALIAAKALRAVESRHSAYSKRSSNPFSSVFRRSGANLKAGDTASMNSLTVNEAHRRPDRPSNVSLSNEDVRALALIAANALKASGERSMSAAACHHLMTIVASANTSTEMEEPQRSISNNVSLCSSISALEKLEARESCNTFSSFSTTNALTPNYSPPLADTPAPIGVKSPALGSAPLTPRSPRDRSKCPSPLKINSNKNVTAHNLFSATQITPSNSVDNSDESHDSKYRKRPRRSRERCGLENISKIKGQAKDNESELMIDHSSINSEKEPRVGELYHNKTYNGSMEQEQSHQQSLEPSRSDSRRRLENARRNFITQSVHNAALVTDSAAEPRVSSAVDERFRTAVAVIRRTPQQQ